MKLQIRKVLLKKLQLMYLNPLLGILMLTLGVISCDCLTGAKGGAVERQLTMKVDPSNGILGIPQTIQVSFNLASNATVVNLEMYQLKISIETKGTGKVELIYGKDTNTQLKVDPATPMQQKLSHFSSVAELTTNNAPLGISFDLKILPGVTEANIKFELLNETGKVIEEGVSVWTSSDKPIDLALERMGSEVLKGDKNTVELKITNKGTQKTEANQLKLKIIRDQGTTATIDGAVDQGGGAYFLSFPETVDAGGGYITKKLVVNLGSDPEAVFKFKLVYKDKEQDGEVRVTCKQGTIEFHDMPKRFVGDYVVEFGLFNDTGADIQTSDFTLELESDNKATFQFVVEKQTAGNAKTKLEEVYRNQVIKQNGGFGGVKFRIDHPNGENKAGVVVKLKKGTQAVVVSEKILWEANGVDLRLEPSKPTTGFSAFKVKNIGKIPVNTDDILVIFTNPQGISFKLGNVIGTNINASLTEIVGTNSVIQSGQFVFFEIQLVDDPKNISKYGAELNLELSDRSGNVLSEGEELWRNEIKLVDFSEKVKSVASNHMQIEDEFEQLNALNNQEKGDEAWIQERISTFKLRSRAVASVNEYRSAKLLYKGLLDQQKSNLPAILRDACEKRINLADDYLVQKIDDTLLQNFSLVDQKAAEVLEIVKHLVVQNNQERAKKYIATINKWTQIATRFAREIGTSEAKELARKVNEYKNQAEDLVKK